MNEMPLPVSTADAPALGNGATPGLIWAFWIHADGTPQSLPIDAPIDNRRDGWLWLHFNLVDARACALLPRFDDLPAEAAELLVGPDGGQQLVVANSCVYGVVADLINDVGGVTRQFGYLRFAMTDKLLVSARRHAMNAAETARQALAAGRKLTRVGSLLELIVDHVADSIDKYADQLDQDTDGIEEEVWSRDDSNQRQRLAGVRKATIHLHRQLQGLLALFHRVGRELGSEHHPDLV
jgi:zinc transporter